MRTVPICPTSDGVLYYRVDGVDHGDRCAVILAHGRYSTHRSWFQQVPALSRRRRVVSFDARGFGSSTLFDGSKWSMACHLGDLEALVAHLGLTQVAIVGQSMGGFAALAFALAHPDMTSALVLTDTPAGIDHPSVLRALATATKERLALPVAERVFRPVFRSTHPELVQFSAAELDASPTFDEGFLDPLLCGGGPTAADCSTLTVPTLILCGQHDSLVPPLVVEAVAAVLPRSQVSIIEDCGHCAFLEQPAVYNATINEFLDLHEPETAR